jgi:hypothetical protein
MSLPAFFVFLCTRGYWGCRPSFYGKIIIFSVTPDIPDSSVRKPCQLFRGMAAKLFRFRKIPFAGTIAAPAAGFRPSEGADF